MPQIGKCLCVDRPMRILLWQGDSHPLFLLEDRRVQSWRLHEPRQEMAQFMDQSFLSFAFLYIIIGSTSWMSVDVWYFSWLITVFWLNVRWCLIFLIADLFSPHRDKALCLSHRDKALCLVLYIRPQKKKKKRRKKRNPVLQVDGLSK